MVGRSKIVNRGFCSSSSSSSSNSDQSAFSLHRETASDMTLYRILNYKILGLVDPPLLDMLAPYDSLLVMVYALWQTVLLWHTVHKYQVAAAAAATSSQGIEFVLAWSTRWRLLPRHATLVQCAPCARRLSSKSSSFYNLFVHFATYFVFVTVQYF